MISVITLLALDNINVSSIQISTLYNFCSLYFFPRPSLKDIKTFIENQLTAC